MQRRAEATLANGQKIQYIITDNPPKGAMKHTYFTPDRSRVVQFFNNPAVANDPNTRKRIEAIIGKYNPTLSEEKGGAKGNTEAMAEYFSHSFCWPTAIVVKPEFGIVCPSYPSNFFFSERAALSREPGIDLKGKDKKSDWFTSPVLKKNLAKEELGDFRNMLKISASLARSVRRMHQAGLAHSDLSSNNVLIDPKSGSCVIIDIDSLVVPGIYNPEVLGSSGYIAPEVLETINMLYSDERKKMPSDRTDLHAMAVLIYEYLLGRHPLIGPKKHSNDIKLDNYMSMGPEALFIENPKNRSNRPQDLRVTIKNLGPGLERLFLGVFVDGLHDPDKRPLAAEWERTLADTLDLLYPCENPDCDAKWFILHDPKNPVCPFCGSSADKRDIVRLRLKRPFQGRNGQWAQYRDINVYNDMPLFKWHVFDNTYPDEKTDTEKMAHIRRYNGRWILVNEKIRGMVSPNGTPVPPGKAISLEHGKVFRICSGEKRLLVEVCFADQI